MRLLHGAPAFTSLHPVAPAFLSLLLAANGVACGSDADTTASASATATHTVAPAPPPPTASATASASAGPTLPGTALKEVLKNLKGVMVLSKTTGAMGAPVMDKKDVAALVASIGTDQTLTKPFDSKCVTPIRIDFQSNDGKSLGLLGFCDDVDFKEGRYDGSGAQQADVKIKDPAGFKAAMKKAGAIK